MEDKIVCYVRFPVIILMILFSFFNGAVSEVYNVGDENGWNSEVDYASWTAKYNFTVGDILEFKYNKGQHNAFEVTESTYRTCESSSGVLAKYESGEDKVKLNESKKYWFVCNVTGHCLGGMRFGIQVKAGHNTTTNSEPVPSVNSACISAFDSWSFGICLFAFGILLCLFS
ncbi:mavicyanin-like [Hibiscus syriacus]|nr:mavicyanin-like [Hibiscus syriacus]